MVSDSTGHTAVIQAMEVSIGIPNAHVALPESGITVRHPESASVFDTTIPFDLRANRQTPIASVSKNTGYRVNVSDSQKISISVYHGRDTVIFTGVRKLQKSC